uniref:Reverse transcriptase domain-containing protein n=1 Tax=Oryza brachyantha TaxID=4533 RepID=J3L5S3_ORYBR
MATRVSWRDVVAAGQRADSPDERGPWTKVEAKDKRRKHSRRSPSSTANNHRAEAFKPIPRWLVGRCFKCLGLGHSKAFCTGARRCFCCWREGHVERHCPDAPRREFSYRREHTKAVTITPTPLVAKPAKEPAPTKKQPAKAAASGTTAMARCGDPERRPTGVRRCSIPWMSGMQEREVFLSSHSLLASVRGNRHPVSPEMLVSTVVRECAVRHRDVRVEVSAPHDFLVTFANPDDCTRVVLYFSGNLSVSGCRIHFCQWSRRAAAGSSEMRYLIKLGIEGLPAHAWEEGAVRIALAGWCCHLVELLPSADARMLEVVAWSTSPGEIPKEVLLAIPDMPPLVAPTDPDDAIAMEMENAASPQPPPSPPKKKSCLDYNLLVHLLEVVDPSPRLEGYDAYFDLVRRDGDDDDSGEDRWARHPRRHFLQCFPGRVDGTGPPRSSVGGSQSCAEVPRLLYRGPSAFTMPAPASAPADLNPAGHPRLAVLARKLHFEAPDSDTTTPNGMQGPLRRPEQEIALREQIFTSVLVHTNGAGNSTVDALGSVPTVPASGLLVFRRRRADAVGRRLPANSVRPIEDNSSAAQHDGPPENGNTTAYNNRPLGALMDRPTTRPIYPLLHRHQIPARSPPSSTRDLATEGMVSHQEETEKTEFLDELQMLGGVCQGRWAIVGDFNMIASAADKNNNRINRRQMAAFRNRINQLEVKELYLFGRRYTWSNEQERPTQVKLDKVLVSMDWEEAFPEAHLQALSSSASDHCPLLLTCGAATPRRCKFKFENFWVKLDGFSQAVQEYWSREVSIDDAFTALYIKMARLARTLKKWGQRRLGEIKLQLQVAHEIIYHLDVAQDCRVLQPRERWLRAAVKGRCLGLAALERTRARQRAKIKEIHDGDASAAFFQLKAKIQQRKLVIHCLQHNNVRATTQQEMLQMARSFFQEALSQPDQERKVLNFSALGFLREDLTELEAEITEDEVWRTIKQLPTNKAPGPDGFTGLFYQCCWDIIKPDIMRAILKFFSGNSQNFGILNSATIILLPKKEAPVSLKDYRPISLIHSFSKLVTKLMASRLARGMGDLVSPTQSAFIKGRSLHENFMFVSGLSRKCHTKKVPMAMLKLDISRAFDSVIWQFLLELLRARGFGRKWCAWVCSLLQTSTTTVTINCEESDPITPARRLRQGDPLSPLLFVLVMDTLQALVKTATTSQLLAGLERSWRSPAISLYADDVIVFFRPTDQEAHGMRIILDLFGASTGL